VDPEGSAVTVAGVSATANSRVDRSYMGAAVQGEVFVLDPGTALSYLLEA